MPLRLKLLTKLGASYVFTFLKQVNFFLLKILACQLPHTIFTSHFIYDLFHSVLSRSSMSATCQLLHMPLRTSGS